MLKVYYKCLSYTVTLFTNNCHMASFIAVVKRGGAIRSRYFATERHELVVNVRINIRVPNIILPLNIAVWKPRWLTRNSELIDIGSCDANQRPLYVTWFCVTNRSFFFLLLWSELQWH